MEFPCVEQVYRIDSIKNCKYLYRDGGLIAVGKEDKLYNEIASVKEKAMQFEINYDGDEGVILLPDRINKELAKLTTLVSYRGDVFLSCNIEYDYPPVDANEKIYKDINNLYAKYRSICSNRYGFIYSREYSCDLDFCNSDDVNKYKIRVYFENDEQKIPLRTIYRKFGIKGGIPKLLMTSEFIFVIYDVYVLACPIVEQMIDVDSFFIANKLAKKVNPFNFMLLDNHPAYIQSSDKYLSFHRLDGTLLFTDKEIGMNYDINMVFSLKVGNSDILILNITTFIDNKSINRVYRVSNGPEFTIQPYIDVGSYMEQLYWDREKFFSDIEIECIDGNVIAHRFLLSLHSEYLESCLTNENFSYAKTIKTNWSVDVIEEALKILYGVYSINIDIDIDIEKEKEKEEKFKGDNDNEDNKKKCNVKIVQSMEDRYIIPLLVLGDEWISKKIINAVLLSIKNKITIEIGEKIPSLLQKYIEDDNAIVPDHILSFLGNFQ